MEQTRSLSRISFSGTCRLRKALLHRSFCRIRTADCWDFEENLGIAPWLCDLCLLVVAAEWKSRRMARRLHWKGFDAANGEGARAGKGEEQRAGGQEVGEAGVDFRRTRV